MNKAILIGLLIAVALANNGIFGKGKYIPIESGRENIITFGCGEGVSYSNISKVNTKGTYTFEGLPSWASVIDKTTIAGVPPASVTPTAVVVYYTDSNGKQQQQMIVLAPNGTSSSSTVQTPAGVSIQGISINVQNGGSATGTVNTISGSNQPGSSNQAGFNGGNILISSIPSTVYIPGSTSSSLSFNNPNGNNPNGNNPNGNNPNGNNPFGNNPNNPNGNNPNGNNPNGNNPNGNNPNGNNPNGNNPNGNNPSGFNPNNPFGNNPNGNNPNGFSFNGFSQTSNLITVVMPASSYPTPNYINITSLSTPSFNTNQLNNLPASLNPQQTAAILARLDAANKH